jgi:PAS domain S-box-containing protein
MGDAVRAFDWACTPLGPMDSWPRSLRVAVGICLNSRFPMFVWWGPELINIYNDAYAPMLGQRHPRALGRPAHETWADIWSVVGPQADLVMTRGEATWNERVLLVMERNGFREDTYFTWSYSPIPDDVGRVAGLFCACTEETPRVLAEAAARDAESRYRAVFEAARDALVIYTADGIIAEVNPAACRLYGYAYAELVGADARQAVHPDALPLFDEFRRVVAAGGDFRCETVDRRKDGTPFPIEVVGTSVTFNGRPHLMSVIRDITDRERAQAAVRESEARFRNMSDHAPVMIWVTRADGYCEYLNPRWYAFTGQTVEQSLGLGWLEAVHPDDAKRAADAFLSANGRRAPFQAEYRLRRADGEYRWCVDSAAPRFGPGGEFGGYVGSVIDMTDRKRAEEQKAALLEGERAARIEAERASRMKDEFLATLSHELRTPLNAILGWAQILLGAGGGGGRGPIDPADLRDGLEVIDRNARAQTQIIEDLLDMSRIVSGNVRLDVRRIDLAPVVRAALETVRPAADAKGIRVRTVLDPLAGPVSGDPGRLQQVFWNLLTNAIKFTPRGGQVHVTLERVNSHLEVRVADTGEGIPPEFLPFVFDRFRQADASTTRRHGGLGLGLAIVRQIVELHGGAVRAESGGPGQGATFTVDLPLAPFRADPGGAGADAAERRHPRAGDATPVLPDTCVRLAGVRVLVVDDEPDARALVRRLLEDCDAVVATAATAAEAFDRVRADRPDVLVSDIGMPGEDGYALVRRLRSLPAEQGGRIPALALTAYARAEDRMKAVLAGFQMHVAKPVEPAELLTMVAILAGRTPEPA